ncbi:MAG TPA: hypothetical protein VEJ16_14215 [Alphaproteobacteria bacterium]|nr:hypothetical protein [Alphaproteobacteria bacterium]
MRSESEETTRSRRFLTSGYEPSVDELLNDPVVGAIMRYDRITQEDVRKVLDEVKLKAALRRGSTKAAPYACQGRPTLELQTEPC